MRHPGADHGRFFFSQNPISCSCYRDSVVSAGNRYNVGSGTNNIGNGGHLSVASAASLDSEARRFSIDSGDVRADFYSKKKKKKRRAFLGYKGSTS